MVERRQGVSTHRWACTPSLWGPLLLRDLLQFSLGPRGTQLPCEATRRHCRSLGGGEAMYRQEETCALCSSFTQNRGWGDTHTHTLSFLGGCLVQSAQRFAHGLNQAAGGRPLSWPPRMSYQPALNTLHTRCDSRPLGSLKTLAPDDEAGS